LSETTLKERDNLDSRKRLQNGNWRNYKRIVHAERLNTTSNEAFFQSLIEMRHILNPFTKKH
jgi:hypothetical protein